MTAGREPGGRAWLAGRGRLAGSRNVARDQRPNQRARRVAPNWSFSAAYSSAGS